MTWLYVLAALAVLASGWFVWALRTGGKLEKLNVAESTVKAQRDQLSGSASLQAVCEKPFQFSCWNKNDPNEPKIRAVTYDDVTLRDCLSAVLAALDPRSVDPTQGSKHYCVVGLDPWWATGRQPVATIGNHKFFNDVA